jgi:hypothetical protein
MRRTWMLWVLIALAGFALVLGGCGEDDVDSDDGDDLNLPPVDDDDDVTDDDTTPGDDDDTTPGDDDTSPDDDDTTPVDDDDDDTTPPDPENEYDPVICRVVDPEGIGAGNHVGGGPVGDTLTVYVYDDITCAPIEGATVLTSAGQETTDVDGYAAIDLTKAEEQVTAYAAGYGCWTYQADAAVMYFRLRPIDTGLIYQLTPSDGFYVDGDEVEFTNPMVDGIAQLLQLLSNPIYLGAGYGGVSRQQLLSLDLDAIFTDSVFRIDIDVDESSYYLSLPQNIYLPQLGINDVFGITVAMPEHDFYQSPYFGVSEESPLSGFLMALDLGAIVNLQTLQEILQAIANGDDIAEILFGLVPDLIADGLTLPLAGTAPTWDGEGSPELAMAELVTVKDEFDLSITGADENADYLAAVLAEVPNRTLTPLSLGLAVADTVTLQYADIPDADYILAGIKTDLIASEFATSNLSLAFQYGGLPETWADGATFADADFLPYFNEASTGYNSSTQKVTWQLQDDGEADAYLVAIFPTTEGERTVLATLPGDVSEFTIPSELGFVSTITDIAVVVAIDLPDDVDLNEWSPIHFWQYNAPALAIWTQPTLIDIIMGLFTP